MQVERDLICRLLQSGRVKHALSSGIEAKHFLSYKAEWSYIKNHYVKYGEIPSLGVFKEKFPDFKYTKLVGEEPSVRPAIDLVKENYIENSLGKLLKKTAKQLGTEDPTELLEEMSNEAQKLKSEDMGEEHVDIVKTMEVDVAEFQRLQNPDVDDDGIFISTPWEALNKRYGGFRGGQVIGILARPNQGKSWISELIAINAAYEGKRVFFASLEMPRIEIAQRFHTVLSYMMLRDGHTDERVKFPDVLTQQTLEQFFTGKYGKHILRNTHLSFGHNSIEPEEYLEWSKKAKKAMKGEFILHKTGSKAFTSDVFARYVEKTECDIAVLDYLTLLEDKNGKRDAAEKWSDVTRKLKRLAQKFDIPIIVCAQANRGGAKRSTPQLDDVYYSDALSQNVDRMLSIKNRGNTMAITSIKNRHGQNQFRFVIDFYPEYGIFEQNSKFPVEEGLDGEDED